MRRIHEERQDNSGAPDRTQQIFAEAMQLSPSRRAAFLDQACANQPDQRNRIPRVMVVVMVEVEWLEEW